MYKNVVVFLLLVSVVSIEAGKSPKARKSTQGSEEKPRSPHRKREQMLLAGKKSSPRTDRLQAAETALREFEGGRRIPRRALFALKANVKTSEEEMRAKKAMQEFVDSAALFKKPVVPKKTVTVGEAPQVSLESILGQLGIR